MLHRTHRSFVALAAVGALLAAGGAASRTHRVEQGETLGELAHRYGVSLPAMVAHNAIADPDHILAGSVLALPESGTPSPVPAALATPAPSVRPAPTSPVVIRPDRARLASVFDEFALRDGVPADLVKAMAWQESGWQSPVTSSTGAVGVMQLMPATVDFTSQILLRLPEPLDARDPTQNIRMGTRFLRYLLDRSGGDVEGALAAYYQGLRSVRERGVFPSTERYIANVKALRARF